MHLPGNSNFLAYSRTARGLARDSCKNSSQTAETFNYPRLMPVTTVLSGQRPPKTELQSESNNHRPCACRNGVNGGATYDSDEEERRRLQEEEDDEDYFKPEEDNVAFASAGDGWAFTLGQFAAMYAARMGGNPKALQKVAAPLNTRASESVPAAPFVLCFSNLTHACTPARTCCCSGAALCHSAFCTLSAAEQDAKHDKQDPAMCTIIDILFPTGAVG